MHLISEEGTHHLRRGWSPGERRGKGEVSRPMVQVCVQTREVVDVWEDHRKQEEEAGRDHGSVQQNS